MASASPAPLSARTFYERGQCLVQGCDCAEWSRVQGTTVVTVPHNHYDLCGCGHSWLLHVVTTHLSRRGEHISAITWHKGGYASSCGGFHPENVNGTIEHGARCVCGVHWGAHASFSTYVAAHTPLMPATSPSTIPITSLPNTASPLSFPPPTYGLSVPGTSSQLLAPRASAPISVFRPPQPLQGNVAQQRRESAQRTLPQHSNAHINSRRGGPRASFPTSQAPTPFDPVVTVMPSSTPARATPTVRTVNVVFVILPFCLTAQGQDTFIAPPQISFKPEQAANFFSALEAHALVFQQSVSATEGEQCIWPQLYASLSRHADTHHFLLPMGSLPPLPLSTSSSPSSLSSTSASQVSDSASTPPLHESPWVIMKKKRSSSGAFYTYKLEANHNLYTHSLNFKWLTGNYPKEMRHPTWSGPLIVFGMREGNLHAPLSLLALQAACSCHSEVHGCFPFRAFHRSPFFKFHDYPEDDLFQCRDDLCPDCVTCSPCHYHPPTISVARSRVERIIGSACAALPGARARPSSQSTEHIQGSAALPSSARLCTTQASLSSDSRPTSTTATPPSAGTQPYVLQTTPSGSSSTITSASLGSALLEETSSSTSASARAVLAAGSRLSLFPLSELQTWQLAMSDHYDVSRPDVLFKGDSPDDVARGLLAALSHIVEFQDPDVRPPFQLPPGIQRALLRSVCDLFCTSLGCVSFCAGEGVGEGVARYVIHRAVCRSTSSTLFWSDRGRFKFPNFLPNSLTNVSRVVKWETFGIIASLHMLVLGAGPEPICPFFIILSILFAVRNANDEDPISFISLPLLQLLDTECADMLSGWLHLSPTDTLPTELTSPISQFIMNVGEVEISQVRGSHGTEQEHRKWTSFFINKVLFPPGRLLVEDWGTNKEFLAFIRGLQVQAPGGNDDTFISLTVSHFTKIMIPQAVASLYTLKVTHPAQISTRLSAKYVTDGVTREHIILQHLFFRALHRYLHGHGHPDHELVRSVGQISEEAFTLESNNIALRAQLLLEAVTDRTSLPLDSLWSITITFNTSLSEKDDVPINFHTCMTMMEVTFTSSLRTSIIQAAEMSDANVASRFDAWLHCQLLYSPGNYNEL